MTHSEPGPGSERPSLAKIKPLAIPQSESERDSRTTLNPHILAKPPSSCAESIEENDTTRMGPLLISGGCKAMVSAGITDAVLTAAKKSREFLNAFRTRSTNLKPKEILVASDIVGHFKSYGV